MREPAGLLGSLCDDLVADESYHVGRAVVTRLVNNI